MEHILIKCAGSTTDKQFFNVDLDKRDFSDFYFDEVYFFTFYLGLKKRFLHVSMSFSSAGFAFLAKFSAVLQSLFETSQERANVGKFMSITRSGRIRSVVGSLSIVPKSPATLLEYQPI